MKLLGKDGFLKLLSRKEGTAALESVILFPVIALVVVSVLEFGHLWLMRHTLTIASREGARAAVVFIPGSDAEREAQARQIARDRVNAYLGPAGPAQWNPGDWTVLEPTITPGPTGTLVGGTLTVRVETNNTLLVLHRFIKDISVWAETTMRFE